MNCYTPCFSDVLLPSENRADYSNPYISGFPLALPIQSWYSWFRTSFSEGNSALSEKQGVLEFKQNSRLSKVHIFQNQVK